MSHPPLDKLGTPDAPDPSDPADPGAAAHAVLAELVSQALLPALPAGPAPALRQRLQQRLAMSTAGEAGMLTRRLASTPVQALAPGVAARCLYQAPAGRALRPGEPLRTWLLDLAPGAAWPAQALSHPSRAATAQTQREWLLLSGELRAGSLALGPLDYHLRPAGLASPAWVSPAGGPGARLFYREGLLPGAAAAGTDAPQALTVHDAQAGWPAYAPGIRRRVLWQHAGQAALLYQVDAGASVPQHGHGHDEECLMVQGDVFLDQRLLRAGDYQLAPAGSGHRVTETDTGGVLYAHGDLDLRFVG